MQPLWQQCVAAGLHGIVVPEAAGGLGLGATELMAVLEQQGRALAQVPLWQQQVAVAALARFGGDGQSIGAVIEAAMQGELLALSLQSLTASRGAPAPGGPAPERAPAGRGAGRPGTLGPGGGRG